MAGVLAMTADELTGDALNEAVVKALGWREHRLISHLWRTPGGVNIPKTKVDFALSFDACLGHLWPDLQARGWEDADMELAACVVFLFHKDETRGPVGGEGSSLSEAFSRAYLKAVAL